MATANNLSFATEADFYQREYDIVFGVDEAGRGCLAGPVCASVVGFRPESNPESLLVTDSKLLSAQKREALFEPIQAQAFAFGIGFASAQEIDVCNIYRATALAVLRAMDQVNQKINLHGKKIQFLADGKISLVNKAQDYFHSPFLQYCEMEVSRLKTLFPVQEKCFVKGDQKVISIAAASILAKVSRDREMRKLSQQYPEYEFEQHKGYSSKKHIDKLNTFGPCDQHRKSFSPVRKLFESQTSF